MANSVFSAILASQQLKSRKKARATVECRVYFKAQQFKKSIYYLNYTKKSMV